MMETKMHLRSTLLDQLEAKIVDMRLSREKYPPSSLLYQSLTLAISVRELFVAILESFQLRKLE